MFDNGDDTLCDDFDMNLFSNCILRFSSKGFDMQMLLNPIEKQLNLPSVAIKKGNVFCFEKEVVCTVSESSTKIWGVKYDAPWRNRIVFTISPADEADCLISQDIVITFKNVFAISDFIIRMRLLSQDVERSHLLNSKESGEIKIAQLNA